MLNPAPPRAAVSTLRNMTPSCPLPAPCRCRSGTHDIDLNSPRIVYQHDNCLLVITSPLDGKPATIANGGTIGFAIGSIEQVEAFHATALAHGGSTCEDPPGERNTPFGAFYLAYVRDPDGNKLCAFHKPA
ncbi:glyoxalase [Burkholderia lata]|nr:glyoxalase [Burkholderia lata]